MEISAQTGQPNRSARHEPGGRKQTMTWLSITVMLVLSVLAVGAPTPATAASSSGAIRISDAHCHEDDGYIACMTAEGVATETITPVGNAIYTGYMKTTSSVTDPAGDLVFESTGTSHYQRLFKDDLLHLLSTRARTTITRSDGVVCTFTSTFHEVSGQVQFDQTESECS